MAKKLSGIQSHHIEKALDKGHKKCSTFYVRGRRMLSEYKACLRGQHFVEEELRQVSPTLAGTKVSGLRPDQVRSAIENADNMCQKWHGRGVQFGICQQGVNAVESGLRALTRGTLEGRKKRGRRR